MRPLHLVGLRGAGDRSLVFYPSERAPLVLTSLVPAMDQEQILGFYQQILVPQGHLPRIEVEWGQSLLPTDRAFLRAMRERHGAQQTLVVVRVLRDQPNVDLQQILLQPEIDAFQHVAISAVDPMENESLVRLAELARFVADIAQERYEEIANELSLCPEAFNTVERRLRTLINPVDILEAVNALIDVQDEAKAIALASSQAPGDMSVSASLPPGMAATVEDQFVWRILSRMLEARPLEEQVLLVALALDQHAELFRIPDFRLEAAQARLRAAQLIRNDVLAGWATWLKEPKQEDILRNVISRAFLRRQSEIRLLRHALDWFHDYREHKSGGAIWSRLSVVFTLLRAGKYGRAEEELTIMEPMLNRDGVTDEMRGGFWDTLGRLRLATGQANDGIDALKRAATYLEKAQAPTTSRSKTVDALACGLRDNGRWAEAEPLFREALRLKEDGCDTLASRAATMRELARGLRENGKAAEADALMAKAERLTATAS